MAHVGAEQLFNQTSQPEKLLHHSLLEAGSMGQMFMPPSSAPILFLFFSWFSPGAHYKATDFQVPGSVLVRFKAVSAFGCFSS